MLLNSFDRNKPHIRPGHCLANSRRIGRIIFALFAPHAIGCDKLWRHQFHSVGRDGVVE
jgi:hypothetical protein